MKKNLIAATLVGFMLTTTVMHAEIIYRQGFHNDVALTQHPADLYGWEWYYSSEGTQGTTQNRITYFSGAPTVLNVNALTPNGDNISQGYWIMAVNADQLGYIPLSIPRSSTDISVSFDVNNNTSSDSDWHIALRFATGAWYVSQDSYNANLQVWENLSVAVTDNSMWIPVTLDPGVSMAISASPAVAFSSIVGDITAAGFYGSVRQASATTHRVDNFTVNAVAATGENTYELTLEMSTNLQGWSKVTISPAMVSGDGTLIVNPLEPVFYRLVMEKL